MDARRPEDAQVPLLLRVGVGAVWIYEGLVPKLLAPSPTLLDLAARWQPFPGAPAAFVRAAGAVEILLGILLIRGWMVRSVAAVQCGLLLLFTAGLGVVMPQSLVHPMGAASKNVTLFAACLCLALLGRDRDARGRAAWADRAVPLILRAGLAFLWIYEGILPKWVFSGPAGIEIVARTGLVPLHIPLFLKLLGLAEAALGFTILAGLWVRGLAVLQVGLLTAFTAIIGWTSPGTLVDPLGGLSKNLGVLGAVLALYRTGGGPFTLDAWLERSPGWRRWRLLASLQWNRWMEIGAVEVYRVQAQAATDGNAHGLLEKLALDEAHHAQDLGSLIRRHSGRPIRLERLCRGAAWVLGCLTVICGPRASLHFDLWMEEHGSSLYACSVRLLPPEAGITARALLGMQNQEAQHIRLLRDHLRAMRKPAPRRRR
jgi:uncharacterized membrane protein YphA (DoxX/SURF4 family)/demethoxyubiquinone hydroxylase (CLK1/Coq7/Cat5 family)